MTALTDLDTTTYLDSSPSAEPTARRLIREIVAVARAIGIEIDPATLPALPHAANGNGSAINGKPAVNGTIEKLEDILVNRVRQRPLTSSMRTDVQNGRTVELEVILGYPLKNAQRLGMDTPILETLYVLVGAIDARNGGRIKAQA